jgi:cytosine deaminase
VVQSSYFFRRLEHEISRNGGLFNAHTHVDRFATAGPPYVAAPHDQENLEQLRLWDKQSYTRQLHEGAAYQAASLRERMAEFLDISFQSGVRRLDSFIDVADDIKLHAGRGALDVGLELKSQFANKIDFRVGAYAPFGFPRSTPGAWQAFSAAAADADFLATSPERDDPMFYGALPDHVGLKEHFRRTLDLVLELRKPIHFHIDQQATPQERGTETLLLFLKDYERTKELIVLSEAEPLIWAVHVISPATYSRRRRKRLLDGLAEHRIGVVCCPSAAISMRKYSFLRGYLNSSIAPILEMLVRGISVRLGTDNVDDLFLPANRGDMLDEIACLANALRFYNPETLAKVATGAPLGPKELSAVKQHLEIERAEFQRYRASLRQTEMDAVSDKAVEVPSRHR